MFTDIDLDELNVMTTRAYSGFNGGAEPLLMTPIGKGMDTSEELILLDASLGPTLAFKDIGYVKYNICSYVFLLVNDYM